MGVVNETIRRLTRRVASLSARGWLATVGLTFLAAVGAVWLCAGDEDMTLVTDEALSREQAAALADGLEARGIPHRIKSGKAWVPRQKLTEAREILSACAAGGEASVFQRLADENDIWRTREQSEKRWQAAKMAALGRLIEAMPAVESATVLFEAGEPKRIGSPGLEPTAAVKVRLTDGGQMTYRLAAAIADLVSGSIAGMSRRQVCIVEDGGRSFRIGEETAAEVEALARRVMAEEYLAEKVAAALGDICGVVVSVQIAPEDAAARRTATVRVPRRYLAAAGRARLGRPGDAEQVRAILIEQTDGIRRTVASVIGARDAADVSVEWYADAPDETLASEAAQAGSGGLYVLAALCAIGGAAAAGLLGLRRFRRQAGKRDESPCRAGRPSLLAEADAHRILELVRDEHPQAIALVLSRLGPAKAAIVLAGLEPARKAEVMRRLDGAEAVAPDIASEVEAALLSRLAGAPGRDEVEREAPRSTAAAAPQAMEPLHGRSFVFEDLAQIPAGRLADGLRILPEEDLVLALRTAGDGLKKKLLSCLPDGSARKIRREMSRIGPVRLMDVEAAQQRVVEALRQAEMGSYAADDGVRREVPA